MMKQRSLKAQRFAWVIAAYSRPRQGGDKVKTDGRAGLGHRVSSVNLNALEPAAT